MGEMKSAYERALERAEALGKLSSEELRERREAEYTPVGRALADRYLKHGYRDVLREEAGRYSGEAKDIVVRAALSRLGEAIELGNYEITERAIEGILAFKDTEEIGEVVKRIKGLSKEYEEAERLKFEEERAGIEREVRELLHQLRISGSAVGEINLEASEAWRESSGKLYSQFNERLEELKRELLNLL